MLTRCCCCKWVGGIVRVAEACKRSRRGGLHATGRSAREGGRGVRVCVVVGTGGLYQCLAPKLLPLTGLAGR